MKRALIVSVAGLMLISVVQADPDKGAGAVPAAENGVSKPVMRRLTREQYRNVISDVFGPDVRIGGGFEPDVRVEGLDALGTSRVSVTPAGLDTYNASAQLIADQVVSEANRSFLIPCKPADPKGPDSACARQFFTNVGELLYRRPLTPAELAVSVEAAGKGTQTLHDFYAGLGASLTGMLSSVPFLFRIEQTGPVSGGKYRLDAYSLASRLSFFLWNTGPDSALLAAARNGDLGTQEGVSKQVERMLKSRRLNAGVRAFFSDMLGFDELATLQKDPTIYPKWASSAANDAREQTLRTLTNLLLRENEDYRFIFTDGRTELTPLLGAIYQVPVPRTGILSMPAGWAPYEFPKGDLRAGILAQLSFTALHSHPGRSSPTRRGKALREVFLCQKVPDPPGNVDFAQFNDPTQPAKTARDRLKAHAVNPVCAGCHKIMDPIGLGLEAFDSSGSFRTTDGGVPIDTSGQLGREKFDNAAGLAQAVSHDPAATSCVVTRLSAYAVGTVQTTQNRPWLTSLETHFAHDGYRLPALIRTIATSPQFAQTDKPEIRAADTVAAN